MTCIPWRASRRNFRIVSTNRDIKISFWKTTDGSTFWCKIQLSHVQDEIWLSECRIGGEGRNRPNFPAVASQICLILLGIQAKSVLSEPIVFNPFGVRFGVRSCPRKCRDALHKTFNADALFRPPALFSYHFVRHTIRRRRARRNPSFALPLLPDCFIRCSVPLPTYSFPLSNSCT